MTESPLRTSLAACALLALLAVPAVLAQTRPPAAASRAGDYIVAVVNQELVTAGELQLRIARVREDAARSKAQLPPADEVRRQVLELLIDERVQVTHARDSGQRVDEAELDRAVANVAVQNQVTLAQLREKLRQEGMDYLRFRGNVRDQMLTERVREREVAGRIRISDAEVEAFLDKRRAAGGAATEFSIAQILVVVPEGASATVVEQRRARVEAAVARVKAGETFEAVARELSEDANKAAGGVIGLRPADRLPDVFVAAVRGLKPGELAPELLRTAAGFHALMTAAGPVSGPSVAVKWL